MPEVFTWTGIGSAFRQAGFKEVARRAAARPIMRIEPWPAAPNRNPMPPPELAI